jgi:hypothetical protein
MRLKDAIHQINYAASKAHSKHTVSNIGQTMVYQEKADEAADFIAANYPDTLSGYPLIEAEVNATGKSGEEVANGIIEQRAIWLHNAAKIEEIRLRGKMLLHEKDANLKVITEETVKALDEI